MDNHVYDLIVVAVKLVLEIIKMVSKFDSHELEIKHLELEIEWLRRNRRKK